MLRIAPLLYTRPQRGRDIFFHRLDQLMLTQSGRVFLHEDYLVTCLSRSQRVLGQYQNVRALVARSRNVDISAYYGA